MVHDKRRDELRSDQDARMEKDQYIFEQQADERVAREHERWIGYFGTTSSQRESARVAVSLYDERTVNTRQLRESIRNLDCPVIEANIRQAGKEIDQRLENQRPERELSYREAQAVRDQWDQSDLSDLRDKGDQPETQRHKNYTKHANGKRDESRQQRQTEGVAQNTPPPRAPEGGKTGVDVIASLEGHLPTWKRNCELRKASADSKRGKTGDVYQLLALDCGGGGGGSGGGGGTARQEKSTTASSSVSTVNFRDVRGLFIPSNTRGIQPLPSHPSSRTLEEDRKESGEKKL